MKLSLIIILLAFIANVYSNKANYAAVLMRDVKVITLHKDQYNAYRRTSPIQQLNCVGGSASSESHKVQTVQCYNMGYNGSDYDWKCEAQLDSHLKLGKATVSCEGYDYPDDPYILTGSCGLEFTLEHNHNTQHHTKHHTKPINTVKHTHTHTKTTIYSDSYSSDILLFLVCVFIFLVVITFSCHFLTSASTPIRTVRPMSTVSMSTVPMSTMSQSSSNVIFVENDRSNTSAFVDGVVMGSVLSQRHPSVHTHTHTQVETNTSHHPTSTYSSTYHSDTDSGSETGGYHNGSNNNHTSTTYAETKRRWINCYSL